MRVLTLGHTTPPFMLPFIRAYPNLARLSVVTSHQVKSDRWPPHLNRQHNTNTQHSAGLMWPHLSAFEGALMYGLCLACPVDRVALHTRRMPHASYVYMLPSILADVRPRRLELHTWPVHARTDSLGNPLPAAFQAVERLEELLITTELGADHADLDMVTPW